MKRVVGLSVEILIALAIGAVASGLASWRWLDWFSPPAIMVFAAVTAMVWLAMPSRSREDHELERMLRREEAESG